MQDEGADDDTQVIFSYHGDRVPGFQQAARRRVFVVRCTYHHLRKGSEDLSLRSIYIRERLFDN